MTAHTYGLAWRILWTEKPGGLQSMGSQRVRHDRATERAHTPLIYSAIFISAMPQSESALHIHIWGYTI